MAGSYDERFFDWVALTASRSARIVVPIVAGQARVASICDVGCGEGVWLAEWLHAGIDDILGVDGDYVPRRRLRISQDSFLARDLSRPLELTRRFDLVQSLEVAEHLPRERAGSFVTNLCAMGDLVLFSAAQPGQGGDGHFNERKASWWAALFNAHGYEAYDCVRPKLQRHMQVDPWYRHNAIVYANAAGALRLSDEALATKCDDPARLDRRGEFAWELRRALLRPLPVSAASLLARWRYRTIVALQPRPAP